MDDNDDLDFFNDEVMQQCFLAESQALEKQRNLTVNRIVHQTEKTSSKNSLESLQDDFALMEELSSWSSQGTKQPASTTRKANSPNSGPSSMQKEQEKLVCLNKRVADLEEQIMLKQGEVSNLRRELMRKDQLMQTEILERYAAVSAAEQKGFEKANQRLVEAQQSQNNLQKQLEKTKSTLNFKTHEVDQLTERCKKLESQKRNSLNNSVSRISQQVHRNNFADRFDFGGKPKVRHIEVQTLDEDDNELKKCDPSIMTVAQIGSLMVNKSKSTEDELECNSLFYSSLATSAHIGSHCSRTDMKYLVEKACGSLDEIISQLESEEPGPWIRLELSPFKWYELQVKTHLKVFRVNLSSRQQLMLDVIRSLHSHVTPIKFDGIFMNEQSRYEVMTVLGQMLHQSHNLSDQMISQLKSTLCGIVVNGGIMEHLNAVFSFILGLSSFKNARISFCTNTDCFMKLFCDEISSPTQDRAQLWLICTNLAKFIQILLNDPPPWIVGSCICPKFLVETFSVHVNSLVRSAAVTKEDGPFLDATLTLMNRWHELNEDWWQRNAMGAQSTSFFSNLVEQMNNIKNFLSPFTLDILKDFGGWDETMQLD